MQLNDRQLEAVEHGNFPLLILAGAGTGKIIKIGLKFLWLILVS